MDVYEFNYETLQHYRTIRGKRRQKVKRRDYLDVVCAFDIETTRLPEIEQSFMYLFAIQIGPDITIFGRTWEEFFHFCQGVRKALSDRWLVLAVHNLSYEFQFLKGWYAFEPDEVFATESRKVLKCTMFDCIEMRCSYMLTNMSLDLFLKKMNVENKKLSGEMFDYSKIRFPWSPITHYEMEYMQNDVKGLVQALTRMMVADGDDLGSVPLTSTGYVRRDMKAAMKGYNHKQLREMLPDADVYRLLREAFRGGNTMSNRFYTDLITENVSSYDMVSSYPNVMLTERFPMTRFYKERADWKHLKSLLASSWAACLFRVSFENIRLSDKDCGCPYIPKDKCRDLIKAKNCNGRILNAEHLEITLTDIDFRIILGMYEWDDMYISDLYVSTYGKLPKPIRETIMQYYRVKTELKGCDPDGDDYLYYTKNKEKLNSTYGMTVEDPCKDRVIFQDNQYIEEFRSIEEMLAEHNRTAFLSYAWGVWVTAWARKNLQNGIDAAGYDFVYCDTDSVKVEGDLDLTEINATAEKKAKDAGAWAADRNGEVHYMGVYESEGYEKPNRFSTMGAKKYVLQDSKGDLHITIAGVDKRKGGKELKKLENFREGFVFTEAGGTESIFNDDVEMTIIREGRSLEIRDNVVIRDSTYTLGITQEYRDILDGLVEVRYADHDIPGYYRYKK